MVASARAVNGQYARTAELTSEASLAQSKLTQSTLRLTAAQARLSTMQTTGKASTAQLAAAQASLVAANDRVALSQERVDKSMLIGARSGDKMRGAWEKIPGPVKGTALAAGIAALASLDFAEKFQTATTRIQTQAGASVEAVDQMRAGILKLAGPTAQAPTELADAMFHIASSQQGIISTAKQLQVLRSAAEGAKLGGADLVDVTNALDAAVVAGIPGVKSFDQAMGALNATVGAGDMTMQNLAEALGTGVLAVVKGYGVTLQQAGAALATFGDNNIRGAVAGTQLRMVVQSLTVPSKLAGDALAKLGLTGKDAFTHFADDLKKGGLTLALRDLHDRLEANVGPTKAWGEVLTQAFTKRAGAGLNVLVQQFDRYDKKLSEVDSKSKEFASDWQAYTQTFQYALHSVISTAEAAGIALGDKLLPDATKALRWLGTDGVHDVEAFWHALSNNGLATGGFHDVESAFGHILSAVGNVVHALGPFERELLVVGGGAVLVGFRALAAVLNGVASVVDDVTGFFADDKVAAFALAGVLTAALTPALARAAAGFVLLAREQAAAILGRMLATVLSLATAFTAAGGGVAGFGAALGALSIPTVGLLAAGAAVGALVYALTTGETATERATKQIDAYVKSLDINYNSVRSVSSAEDSLTARINARTTALKAMTVAQLSAAQGSPIVGRGDQNDTAAQFDAIRQKAIETDPVLKALQANLAEVQANEAKASLNTLELARTLGVSEGAIRSAAGAVDKDLNGSYASLLPKIAGFIASAQLSHHPTQQAAADLKQLGNAANSTSADIGLLDQAWDDLVGNWVGAKAAIATAKQSIAALDQALKASNGSLKTNTKAGQAAAIQMAQTSDAVKSAIDAIFNRSGHFTTQGIKQVHKLVNAMTAGLPKGSAAYKRLVGSAELYMSQLESNAPGHGRKTGSGYAGGIGSSVGEVRRAADRIGNAAKAALSEPGAAAGEGTSLVQGFAAGMNSDSAFIAVASAAAAVITAAISALHHHGKGGSPYKRFMPEGSWAVEGFAMGMDAALPQIDAAAARVVGRAQKALHGKGRAAAMVAGAIARATLPEVTDPTRLSSMLGNATGAAGTARTSALASHDIYRDLKESAKSYDQQAKAADHAAEKAKKHADAMKDDSAAEKAAKKSAEDHAQSLAQLAKQADRTAREADRAANHGQKVWEKLQAAADKATQKAVADAEQLVSVMQSQFDDLASTITDFQSQVTAGLTGDDSLSSIWSALIDAQTSAASDLADAQSALADAQRAVADAGTDATVDQMQAVTDAQNALTKALAAADQANAAASASGVQDTVSQIIVNAQQFAADLQTLIGEGATGPLISQIVEMGPKAGDAFAKSLEQAGASSVVQLSSSLDQIASIAQDAAAAMAGTFYGGGVSAMEQFIEGLEAKFPALTKALDPILKQLQELFAATSGGAAAAMSGPTFRGSPIVAGTFTPRGGDGASMVAVLHPDDRALLAKVATRPVQVTVDGKVIGEVANDYRQDQRQVGNPRFK